MDVYQSVARLSWQKSVMMIECFHLNAILASTQCWSIRKTALTLQRSLGSVSEDLRLSLGLRIYPELGEFKYREEALNYLRDKGKCKSYPYNEWSVDNIETIISTLRSAIKNGTT